MCWHLKALIEKDFEKFLYIVESQASKAPVTRMETQSLKPIATNPYEKSSNKDRKEGEGTDKSPSKDTREPIPKTMMEGRL